MVNIDTHFRVEVSDHQGQIVAIEPEMLAGRDIGPDEESKIRLAADHLSCFLGGPTIESLQSTITALRQEVAQALSSESGAVVLLTKENEILLSQLAEAQRERDEALIEAHDQKDKQAACVREIATLRAQVPNMHERSMIFQCIMFVGSFAYNLRDSRPTELLARWAKAYADETIIKSSSPPSNEQSPTAIKQPEGGVCVCGSSLGTACDDFMVVEGSDTEMCYACGHDRACHTQESKTNEG